MLRICISVAVMTVSGTAALAQDYTTAAEVKPILEATKPQWIAVREFDGNDLLYFTNLLAWRCGVSEIRYGVNGAPVETVFTMEPCHDGTAQPNALMMENGELPYVTLDLGSVQTVSVLVVFDDDSETTAEYQRKAVMTP